jgi:hypothetical protein
MQFIRRQVAPLLLEDLADEDCVEGTKRAVAKLLQSTAYERERERGRERGREGEREREKGGRERSTCLSVYLSICPSPKHLSVT